MLEFLKIISYILIFGAVLLGAYYFSIFMASIQKSVFKSRYIKIEDKIALTKDKSIAIISVGSKNMLVGITKDTISLISEIKKEDMVPVEEYGETGNKVCKALGKIFSQTARGNRSEGKIPVLFRDILKKYTGKERKANDNKENIDDS